MAMNATGIKKHTSGTHAIAQNGDIAINAVIVNTLEIRVYAGLSNVLDCIELSPSAVVTCVISAGVQHPVNHSGTQPGVG
jgi:hypothetical protein